MVKWADYLVSKEKWETNVQRIKSFQIHIDHGDSVGSEFEQTREWTVQNLRLGKTFRCIHKTSDGKWTEGESLTLSTSGALSWNDKLPQNITRRKCFVSYYHKDDQRYKEEFVGLMSDLIVNKSVNDGDINSDISDEYVKQLIQKGHLSDTTVLVILLGAKTKCRKHIDWEISGALNLKVGELYSGVLALILPSHPNYNKGTYDYSEVPPRLADNLKTEYAIIRNYTTDRRLLQDYIELAFKNRSQKSDSRINSRAQMKDNSCS
ncbi:hypothetical protein D3C71_348930 [compost metagenome]